MALNYGAADGKEICDILMHGGSVNNARPHSLSSIIHCSVCSDTRVLALEPVPENFRISRFIEKPIGYGKTKHTRERTTKQ